MENNSKYALITGGTTGIGFELAKLFAKDNYNLVIVARNETELQRASQELKQEGNVEVITLTKDLFLLESPEEIYNELKARNVEVEVLVNNAGQGQYGEFVQTDLYRELDIIQLNITSYVVLTKNFLKDMVVRKSGKILNVGSIAGEIPGPLHSVYHGTKAFINSWSEAIRNELKDSGVTVTVLLPGPTDTDFFNKADMEDAKIAQPEQLSDPSGVAEDGYKALMSGDDKVISGLKNKVQVGMSNFISDSMAAESIRKQHEPVNK